MPSRLSSAKVSVKKATSVVCSERFWISLTPSRRTTTLETAVALWYSKSRMDFFMISLKAIRFSSE
jgi:hypothetical protein